MKDEKFSFLAGEYDTGALINSDAPEIGNPASWGEPTDKQKEIADKQKHEEKLEELRKKRDSEENEDSPSEKRLMVIDGATLSCPYAEEEGKLKVTSNKLHLQDRLWATEGDCANMVNLQFPGLCNHPKWGKDKPPCMSVIFLSNWKNLGTTLVQKQRVLVKESYITCNPTPNTAMAKPIPKVEKILEPDLSEKNTVEKIKMITEEEIELFDTAKFTVSDFKKELLPKEYNTITWEVEWFVENQPLISEFTKRTKNFNLLVTKNLYKKEVKVYAYLQKKNTEIYAGFKVKEITIHPRKMWHARKHQTGKNLSYEQITEPLDTHYDTIVVHHSGNKIDYPTMRQIQDEHMDAWGNAKKADIGYHFGIDRYGNIYEGRPINIKGAHVNGANTGKIGIVLLADLSTDNAGMGWFQSKFEFSDGDLSNEMEKSLLKLCVHLNYKYKVNKLGGHMEIAASSNTDERFCPGNLTMAKIDSWRSLLEMEKP